MYTIENKKYLTKSLFILRDVEMHLYKLICDLGRIQTCNLLSRNQVHYSVMLRGHFVGSNIIAFFIIGYYFIDVLKNNTKKKHPVYWVLLVQFKTAYTFADFTVLMIRAAILYGSPLEAGRRSSNHPFHPFSTVIIGILIDAPRSDTP